MDESSNDHLQHLAEQTIQALRLAIIEKEETIRQRESENRRLTRQLANVETELAQLKGGMTFRLLDRYHRTVSQLLPLNTRRRHLYDRGMQFVHLLLGRPGVSYGTTGRALAPKPEDTEDVIVYQMAKVGSWSVVESLRYAYNRLALPVQVHHVHNLNHLDEFEAALKAQADSEQLEVVQNEQVLRKLIDQDHRRRWKLISLVRDPVARNVSWFFHKLDQLVPDWQERRKRSSLSLDELQEVFLHAGQDAHKIPEIWFDNEMLPVFGIDVFAEPFPSEIGYKIYPDSPRASLLLIRLENLRACASTAMRQFLSLDDFTLIDSNVGDDREYAEVYRAFRRLPLPRTYVESVYSTKFVRHFYSEQEIEKFTRMWTAPN